MNESTATGRLKPFFRFPFQDRQSTKRFVVGCALLFACFLIPIVPALFVYGYALRILRSTAEGEAPAMPAWDDWSGYLNLGFRGGLVGFIFSLPGLAFFFTGMLLYFGTFLVIPLLGGTPAGKSDLLLPLFLIGIAAMFGCMAIGSALGVLGAIPLPAALSHLAVKDKFVAAFRVGEWGRILGANKLGYLIAFVIMAGIFGLSYLIFMMAYFTLVLMCLILFIMIPVSLYALLVGSALFGEAYREGAAALKGK
jgi:hypothetical protein